MAEAKGKRGTESATDDATGAAAAPRNINLGIRLVPGNHTDQPVVSNYTSLNVAPGMAFIDFGFLEPSMLSALPRMAQQGGKLPETVNGKLAVRVAMGYDALANLHQQLGRVLASVNQQRGGGGKT